LSDLCWQARIKVWVLTGDKQETAINIARSCNLLQPGSREIIVNSRCGRTDRARVVRGADEESGRTEAAVLLDLQRAYAAVSDSKDQKAPPLPVPVSRAACLICCARRA
jgi:magnesium-transporting ATPase (P-type)